MQKPVFNTISAIFGKRGSGKTLYFKGSEEFKQPGFIKAYLKKGMKVLIIDTIDHPSYRDIPVIKPEQLASWKVGVYRIWVDADDMSVLNSHINKLDSMWNTLIVYEDAYKHQSDKLDKPIKNLIIDSKQKNIDIIFMYHCWSMAPKDLYRMIDLIEVFKIKEHPMVRKDNMPGYYEEAVIVHNEVIENTNPFFHKLLSTDL